MARDCFQIDFYETFPIPRRLYTSRSRYVAENRCTAGLARLAGAQNPLPPFSPARLRDHVRYSGDSGWVRAEWVNNENGRRARVYELTTAGKKQLGIEESRWKAVAAAVNRVLLEA